MTDTIVVWTHEHGRLRVLFADRQWRVEVVGEASTFLRLSRAEAWQLSEALDAVATRAGDEP